MTIITNIISKDEQNPWEQLKDDIDHGEPPYCEPYFMYVCLNRLEKLDDNIQYLIWVLVGEIKYIEKIIRMIAI